jgi:preprotein translocase subunit SecG
VIYVLYTIHVLVCVFLILVVLLQQGKGADLSVFGGGSTQTAFGARGATTLLHKLTVTSFVIFILTTLAIGIPQLAGGGSVMKGAATSAPAKTPAPSKSTPANAPARPAPGRPPQGGANAPTPSQGGANAPAAPSQGGANAPAAPSQGGANAPAAPNQGGAKAPAAPPPSRPAGSKPPAER